MEVFIIRDGQQVGPFDEAAMQALIKEGKASHEDMAWRAGLPGWLPLKEVLGGAREFSAPPPKPEPAVSKQSSVPSTSTAGTPEKSTAKQRALLSFLGINFAADISKQDAALLVSDALENPKFLGRLNKWSTEKFRQHADIFADELEAKKEHRATHYFELCQIEAAGFVQNITKAHCQVLIDSLDNRFPSWESNPREALWEFFLPGLAEHFPQLVSPEWRTKLKQTSAKLPGALSHSIAHSGKLAAGNSGPTFLQAAFRGIVVGMVVLGAIFFWREFVQKKQAESVSPAPDVSAPLQASAAEPPKVVADGDSKDPSSPVDVANNAQPALDAQSKPSIDLAANPKSSPALVTPPLPEKPGPDPQPEATVLPAPAPAPKDVVTLKKAVQVQLPLGKVTLNAGTRLKFIAVEGSLIRASFNDNVILVPKSVTDADAPPPAAP